MYVVRYGVDVDTSGKWCRAMEDREFTDVVEAWNFFAAHPQAISLFTRK